MSSLLDPRAELQTLKGGYKLWHYLPSIPAAIVFAVIFLVLTGMHVHKLWKWRSWFCIPFVIGGLFEVIGYIGRAIAHNSTGTLGPYIIQSVLLLIAPVLFAGSLYMTLGRLIRALDAASMSPISPRWLTRIFVAGDIFSFLMQSTGAGLLATAGNNAKTPQEAADKTSLGENIIVGGLIFQVVIFAIFVITGIIFHRRFSKRGASGAVIPWKTFLVMLYLTSAFVTVRNVFRVVEYVQGVEGYLLSTEWPVYVFDGVLMIATMLAFWWWHPGSLRTALEELERSKLPSSDEGVRMSSMEYVGRQADLEHGRRHK